MILDDTLRAIPRYLIFVAYAKNHNIVSIILKYNHTVADRNETFGNWEKLIMFAFKNCHA